MHGSFSRADTMNFMAAAGPDFKASFADETPVSNADVGKTIAHILGLNVKPKGRLVGRVIKEAMPGGRAPSAASRTVTSQASANGLRTVLKYQSVGRTRYFDAAGFPGRTVGLSEESKATSRCDCRHSTAKIFPSGAGSKGHYAALRRSGAVTPLFARGPIPPPFGRLY